MSKGIKEQNDKVIININTLILKFDINVLPFGYNNCFI